MGYQVEIATFNQILKDLSNSYKIVAPKRFIGEGTYSDTDRIRYGEIQTVEEIVFDEKSQFSYKEALLPISQTLFYFTENEIKEADGLEKGMIIFLRSCDFHAVKRFDAIYLENQYEDYYYKRLREKAKFIVMGCREAFENCFCVDMGTNTCSGYDAYIHVKDQMVYLESCFDELTAYLKNEKQVEVIPEFVKETKTHVNIPENLTLEVMNSKMWDEYGDRCIACGRCNFVCPTCTCFTMQDYIYEGNDYNKAGERRRIWASCEVDGFTTMAGGHSFRLDKGQRMRYKVLHKVYDFNKRFGYHMCVGCGRCDDICPEYISFSNCVNRLKDAMIEVTKQ